MRTLRIRRGQGYRHPDAELSERSETAERAGYIFLERQIQRRKDIHPVFIFFRLFAGKQLHPLFAVHGNGQKRPHVLNRKGLRKALHPLFGRRRTETRQASHEGRRNVAFMGTVSFNGYQRACGERPVGIKKREIHFTYFQFLKEETP